MLHFVILCLVTYLFCNVKFCNYHVLWRTVVCIVKFCFENFSFCSMDIMYSYVLWPLRYMTFTLCCARLCSNTELSFSLSLNPIDKKVDIIYISTEPDNEYLKTFFYQLNFALTLSYSAEINAMLCPQRVFPPLKKTPWCVLTGLSCQSSRVQ
jgi:hypothetical protein